MTKLRPINEAPQNGDWIWLFGYWLDEPKGCLGFWSETDWYDSEAASHSLTGFGWEPTHYMPYIKPEPAHD